MRSVPASDEKMEKSTFEVQSYKTYKKKKLPEFKGNTSSFSSTKRNPNIGVIHTPTGPCPVKPEGYGQDDWEKNSLDEERIRTWALRVQAAGKAAGEIYSPAAIRYFAKQFWGFDDFDDIRKNINEALGQD